MNGTGRAWLLLVTALSLIVVGCASNPAPPSAADGDAGAADSALGSALRGAGASTVASALEQAPVSVPDGGTVTLLAPNDAAFSVIDADSLASLLSNPEQLARMLAQHTLADAMTVQEMVDRGVVILPDGRQIAISAGPNGPRIGEATVVQGDIVVGDVMVHVIDRVLVEVADLRVKD